MNRTEIEWADYSWNPVTGCRHGCPYCYARKIAQSSRGVWSYPNGFEPTFHPNRIDQPLRKGPASMVFVCSMADLFGDWVPQEWIDRVLDTVRRSAHTFQFLTKNPRRLPRLNPWPGNAWVGASATNQDQADVASRHLAKVDAPVRFVSCEPLLAPVDLAGDFWDWIIVGACTGARRSQPDPAWVDALTAKARAIGAALFYKPNLTDVERVREFPTAPAPSVATQEAATLF